MAKDRTTTGEAPDIEVDAEPDLVAMTKEGEVLHVHSACVGAHVAVGWAVV